MQVFNKRAIIFLRYYSFLFLFIFSFQLNAQDIRSIHLKSADILLKANAQQWLDSAYATGHAEKIQVLLQFSTIPNSAQKEELKAMGIDVLDYVPDNTFVAIINKLNNAQLKASNPLISIMPVDGVWKADKLIWQKAKQYPNTLMRLIVSVYNGFCKPDLEQYLAAIDAKIIWNNMEPFNNYQVEIKGNQINALAKWYGVKYINPVTNNFPLDEDAKESAKINLIAQPISNGGFGLMGDSMVVGIGDNTSGAYHVDLVDRIINYNQYAMVNHGIHINGIVGGAGIIDPNAEGTAFHATLVDHFYDNLIAYTADMRKVHNMTITNNSYVVIEGDCNYAGTYDNYAVIIDQQANDLKDVLHVFAAGNDGALTCSPYPTSWATTCGGYQPAKNNLCVTSTDLIYDVTSTSRGPVKDGRIKPDMCAVGFNVNSCIGTNGYLRASGTSMASPGVAGATALLAQKFKQLNNNQNPRADVLKALLLNGAIDLGTEGPDFHYGFGFLNLEKAIKMLVNRQYDTNKVALGNFNNQTIIVPPNTAQLKILLYWHDLPASPLAAKDLVNDLDLTVTEPNLALHKPLVPNPNAMHVAEAAVEMEDHLNNTEQVIIDNPQSGTYTISVRGNIITNLNQDYVIAYDFIPSGIRITSPVKDMHTSGQNTTYVYWDADKNANTFSLQYSADSGMNWNAIVNNLPDTEIAYRWYAPNHTNCVGLASCLILL